MAGPPDTGRTDVDAASPWRSRLATAPLEVVGRFASASNATLLVRLADLGRPLLAELADRLGRAVTPADLAPDELAVYKPARGEAPLWDFPAGTLHRREVAASLVDRALGWDLVPETVLRTEAPFGPGSVQRFVPHDPTEHFFHMAPSASGPLAEQLRRMVVFDVVIDNADRKAGHVLFERPTGAEVSASVVRLVDHGVSFHVEYKLRTVAWHLAGDRLDTAVVADLRRLRGGLDGVLGRELAPLLAPEEIARLRERIDGLIVGGTLPEPSGDRPVPWPPI